MAVWLHEFWLILITFSTMTSSCRHLSVTNLNSSTARGIVNSVTTADRCVHTADATQLDSWTESRRRRQCVLGLTFLLARKDAATSCGVRKTNEGRAPFIGSYALNVKYCAGKSSVIHLVGNGRLRLYVISRSPACNGAISIWSLQFCGNEVPVN